MQLIETKTLGTASASIEFAAIPQTFTDLYILVSARTTNSAVQKITLDFNGSSANLSNRFLQGNGSVAASYAETLGMIGDVSSDSNTANTFSNSSAYIPNYTGSTNKSWSADSVTENNATAAFQDIIAGLWSQTAAITSLTLKLTSSANFAVGTTASLYGIGGVGDGYVAPKATGGVISYTPGYVVHTFTSSGTFTPTQNLTDVEYLVIAGGGGAGEAGGGAGGYRSSVVGQSSGGGGSAEARLSLTSGVGYTVTVGAGGAAATSNSSSGNNGSSSSFSTISTVGGGGSGARSSAGNLGGSGGGGGRIFGSGDTAGGAGTSNQGYQGGGGTSGGGSLNGASGGGGGAGAIGASGNATRSGSGGAGLSSNITGTAVFRGGGGGGGRFFGENTGGLAGIGGGGAGAFSTGANTATSGEPGTGGGGGGTPDNNNASIGAGGSGIVIVRYAA